MKKWVNLVCYARHEKRVLVEFSDLMESHHVDDEAAVAVIQDLIDFEEYTVDPESINMEDAKHIELDNVTDDEVLLVNVPDYTVTIDEDDNIEVLLGEGD